MLLLAAESKEAVMRRTVVTSAFAALMLLPVLAVAEPDPRWDQIRVRPNDMRLEPGADFDLTCATGGPSSALVALALLGLVGRRRR